MAVSADPNQALLHFRTTTARTVHHHIKHAGHCGTWLARVAQCLARVLTELALLSADLSTPMLHDVVGNTGRFVARTLAEMSAGKRLAAYPVAEHLLAVAGNALHDPVATLAHSIGRNGARRAGTEVAGMVANVATRTRLVAGLVAHRRRRSTRNRGLDDLLAAGTGDRLGYHMATWHARTGVARKIAGVLPAVEELSAHLMADVERPVRLLALVRTANLLALVTTTVQVRFTDTRADEGSAHLLLLLRRQSYRRRQIVQHPARHLSLREGASALLGTGNLAGRARTCVALQRTLVKSALQHLAADLVAAREGVCAALPVRIDFQSKVLSTRTFGC